VSGLLGNNIAYCLKDKYEILGLYHSHPVFIEGIQTIECDLLSRKEFCNLVNRFKPDVIIHCASLTDVDACEVEQDKAYQINVLGTQIVMEALKDLPLTKVIYISSDLVYDGKKGNYSETDPVNPLNYYGLTKLKGEIEALKRETTLVLRTNIFGWNIQKKLSLAEWIISELSCGHTIQGFNDVIFSSIYTFELARIIDLALKKNLAGIYNSASSTSISKYEFGLQVAGLFGLDEKLIHSISIDQASLKAKRAKNISLLVNKLTKDLGIKLPSIKECLQEFYQDSSHQISTKIKNVKLSNIYPQTDIIPYGRQSIDDEDIQAVVSVLKSKNLTQGPKIKEFEEALCQTIGAKYAVVVNSGTAALHLACLVAGIKSTDEVITSSNTFVASANCVVYCKGHPIFADIDPTTYNISIQEIEKKLNNKTRGIIPVHFAGQSCDMKPLHDLIRKKEQVMGHKIYIIEDASHALGSLYENTSVGSCTYSDMTIMSFHPVKHITTGEGGVIFTNNENFNKKLILLRSHGITRYPDDPLPWRYEQIDLGYNYRITDIQAALGISQLKKLPLDILKRREIINSYNEQFKNLESVQIPFEVPKCATNFHLYVLLIDFEKIKMTRSQVMGALKEDGIQSQVHYIPVHTQPFYKNHFGTNWGDLPNTEKYYQKCLSIPLSPAMNDLAVSRVIKSVTKILG